MWNHYRPPLLGSEILRQLLAMLAVLVVLLIHESMLSFNISHLCRWIWGNVGELSSTFFTSCMHILNIRAEVLFTSSSLMHLLHQSDALPATRKTSLDKWSIHFLYLLIPPSRTSLHLLLGAWTYIIFCLSDCSVHFFVGANSSE